MKRSLALLVTSILVLCIIGGCSNNGSSGSNTTTENSSSSGVVSEVNTPEGVSETFIKALVSSDYDTALDCLGLEEGKSFVTAEDIEFFLPRSSFSKALKISGLNCNYVSKIKNSSSDKVVCLVDIEEPIDNSNRVSETFTVNTVLNKGNQWVVDAKEFYYENYKFRTASNVKVTVNGKEVDDSLGVLGTITGLEKEYTLPYVGKKGIDVSIECDNYSFSKTLETSSNNEISKEDRVFKVLNDSEAKECADAIKETWNNLYKGFKGGKEASDFINYFYVDVSSDVVDTVWNGFKKMTKNNSGVGSDRDDNFNLTECIAVPEVLYVSDNEIYINFNYKLTWDYILANANQSMKRNSTLILSKESDGYKIYKLVDEKLFSENNNFIQEW